MNDKGLTIPKTVIQQFILSSGAVQNNKSNLETLARIFVEIIGGLVKASISVSDKQKLRTEDISQASASFRFKPFFVKSDIEKKPELCAKSYKNGDVVHYRAVRNCVFTRLGTFKRVVRTLMKQLGHSKLKVSSPALGAMQKTAESIFRYFLNETVKMIIKQRISMKQPVLVRKIIDKSYTNFKKINKVMPVARLLTNKHKINNSTCDKLIGLVRDLKRQITKLEDKFERQRTPPTPGKVDSSSQTESLQQSELGSSGDDSSGSDSDDSGSGRGSKKSDTSNNDEEMFMLNNLRNLQEQNTKLQRQLNQEKTDKENYQKMFEILQESLENQPSPTNTNDTSGQSENATNDIGVQSDLTSDDIDNLENELVHQKVLNMNDKTRSKNALLDQELEALTERMKSNAATISHLQNQELETVSQQVRGLNHRQQLINQGTGIISNLQTQIQELKNKPIKDTQTTSTQTEDSGESENSGDSGDSDDSDDSDDSRDSDDSAPRRDSGYESDDQALRDKWFELKNSLPEDIKKAAFGNLDHYDPFDPRAGFTDSFHKNMLKQTNTEPDTTEYSSTDENLVTRHDNSSQTDQPNQLSNGSGQYNDQLLLNNITSLSEQKAELQRKLHEQDLEKQHYKTMYEILYENQASNDLEQSDDSGSEQQDEGDAGYSGVNSNPPYVNNESGFFDNPSYTNSEANTIDVTDITGSEMLDSELSYYSSNSSDKSDNDTTFSDWKRKQSERSKRARTQSSEQNAWDNYLWNSLIKYRDDKKQDKINNLKQQQLDGIRESIEQARKKGNLDGVETVDSKPKNKKLAPIPSITKSKPKRKITGGIQQEMTAKSLSSNSNQQSTENTDNSRSRVAKRNKEADAQNRSGKRSRIESPEAHKSYTNAWESALRDSLARYRAQENQNRIERSRERDRQSIRESIEQARIKSQIERAAQRAQELQQSITYTQPSTNGISIFERNPLEAEISDTSLSESDLGDISTSERNPLEAEISDTSLSGSGEIKIQDIIPIVTDDSDASMSGLQSESDSDETEEIIEPPPKRRVSIPRRFQTEALQDTPEGRSILKNRDRRN